MVIAFTCPAHTQTISARIAVIGAAATFVSSSTQAMMFVPLVKKFCGTFGELLENITQLLQELSHTTACHSNICMFAIFFRLVR